MVILWCEVAYLEMVQVFLYYFVELESTADKILLTLFFIISYDTISF